MALFKSLSSDSPLPKRIFMLFQVFAAPIAPFGAYLVGMILGLKGEQALRSVLLFVPPAIVIFGNLYPHLLINAVYRRAIQDRPGDTPGKKLGRLMKMPWRIAVWGMLGSYALGAPAFTAATCLAFGTSPWRIPWAAPSAPPSACCSPAPSSSSSSAGPCPWCSPSRSATPHLQVRGRGFFWVRQSWFLPYSFAVCILSIVVLGGMAVGVQANVVEHQLAARMEAAGQAQAAAMMEQMTYLLLSQLSFPIILLLVVMLSLSTFTAWMLARRQERGAQAVLRAIEGISVGKVMSPEWASPDEIGDLAFGLTSITRQLSLIPKTLQSSALQLIEAGDTLKRANDAQRRALSTQAAAIQQTNVTAQEIKQTSDVTAARAELVLNVVTRAEQLGRAGTAAIEETMAGFSAVRDTVHAIRAKMERLQASARQIGEITQTVKDLADQSNLLALNAAIESVRTGEPGAQGRGFGVVAREIRSLADQSIRATGRIRGILDEIGSAVREAVAITDAGAAQVEGGLQKVRSSGDSLHQLSEMVHDSASAVRQITVAVGQQNAGFTQIFTAVADLSNSMEQAMERLESTQVAAQTLQRVTDQVNRVARQYHLD
jgi:methyl-accepting chemotaxis protein